MSLVVAKSVGLAAVPTREKLSPRGIVAAYLSKRAQGRVPKSLQSAIDSMLQSVCDGRDPRTVFSHGSKKSERLQLLCCLEVLRVRDLLLQSGHVLSDPRPTAKRLVSRSYGVTIRTLENHLADLESRAIDLLPQYRANLIAQGKSR